MNSVSHDENFLLKNRKNKIVVTDTRGDLQKGVWLHLRGQLSYPRAERGDAKVAPSSNRLSNGATKDGTKKKFTVLSRSCPVKYRCASLEAVELLHLCSALINRNKPTQFTQFPMTLNTCCQALLQCQCGLWEYPSSWGAGQVFASHQAAHAHIHHLDTFTELKQALKGPAGSDHVPFSFISFPTLFPTTQI